MRTRSIRRHNDWQKAIRKRNICCKVYGWDYYNDLHVYSKNKIHCSCPLCSCKTKNKHTLRRVPVRTWSLKDLRKINSMQDEENEYSTNDQGEVV